MGEEKKTERVSVRMTPTLKAVATEIAASENRTLSNYIESLIVEQVQKIKNKKSSRSNGSNTLKIITPDN